MNFEFLRPVFTGDTIDCRVAIEQCEKTEKDRTAIRASFECINQHGKPVRPVCSICFTYSQAGRLLLYARGIFRGS